MHRQVPLKNVKYTGLLMRRLACKYRDDVAPFSHMGDFEFFDMVKSIPWRSDGEGKEKLQRPYYTLARNGIGGDCDDKNIVLGARFALQGRPFRFIALSKNDSRFHHVATEALFDGKWLHLDPTYSYNQFGLPLCRYKRKMIIS